MPVRWHALSEWRRKPSRLLKWVQTLRAELAAWYSPNLQALSVCMERFKGFSHVSLVSGLTLTCSRQQEHLAVTVLLL